MRKIASSILLTQKTFNKINKLKEITNKSKNAIIEEALIKYFKDNNELLQIAQKNRKL